jgi:RNA recognition motif-containing protein
MNTMDKTIKPSRTLFISELPAGMQEADLFALFQKCEGFTTARVRTDRNNRLVGFVDFESAEVAVEAKEKYNGYHVSPDDERSVLTIQFAHNSTRPKKTTDSPIEHRSDEHQSVLAAPRNPINTAVTPAMLNNNTATPAVNGNVAKPPRNTSYKDNVPKNFDAHPLATWNQYNQNLPTEASSTLYVEGLPIDATEREMSHIFRPFPGFQSLRIISKTMRGKVFNLCFVEFDNKAQATSAMNILQGYRMDINDVRGLKMSYAKTERRDRRVTSPRAQGVNMSPIPMMSPDGSQLTAVGVPVTAQGPPTGLAAPNGMSVPGHALPAMNVAPQPQHHPHHHPVTVAAQPGNPPPYVHPAAAGLPPNHMALHHQQRNFKLPPQPRK